MPPFHEELLVPFPPTLADQPTVTHTRGTLILTSRKSLQRLGWFERYRAHLPQQHELTIASSTANSWLPLDVALAHYRAADAIGLTEDEQLAVGAAVVHALQKTFLGSVIRTAGKGAGVSPLPALEKFFHLYARSFKGGGGRMVRIGPKDVRVEFVGNPAAAIRYFRVAYRGFITAGCETFAQRVVTAELAAYGSPTSVAYRLAWV